MLMCRYHYVNRLLVYFLLGEADSLTNFFLHNERMLHYCTSLCLAPELRPNSDIGFCGKRGSMRVFCFVLCLECYGYEYECLGTMMFSLVGS